MVRLIRPDVPFGGTVVEICVDVAAPTFAYAMLRFSVFFAAAVSKFVPVTVRAAPGNASVGEMLVIAGPAGTETRKLVALAALPFGVVTDKIPDVAPGGTVTVKLLAVADVTVADTPLNVTVF